MSDLSNVSTQALATELSRRGTLPSCKCGKWRTYMGAYDRDGYTIRCHGCLKAIGKCTC